MKFFLGQKQKDDFFVESKLLNRLNSSKILKDEYLMEKGMEC